MSKEAVIRLKPFTFVHVLDNNSNVTRVECGPKIFTPQEHEKVVAGPSDHIRIPPRHYARIRNPVLRDEKGQPLFDQHQNPKLRHGDSEIRFDNTPAFFLYPGEVLEGRVTQLSIVAPNTAYKLKALRDTVFNNVKRSSGDEWLFEGPQTYLPSIEVEVIETIKATIIAELEALRLRAKKNTVDRNNTPRKAGEEWLIRQSGAYIPNVDEEIVQKVPAVVLTDKKAIHLRAKQVFIDVYGTKRQAGEEWLVTSEKSSSHIPDVYEEVVGTSNIITLDNRQYCYVLDPVVNGKPCFGQKELRKGERSFFLLPGERLESGIQNVHVLGEEEALLLRAKLSFKDGANVRQPGDRWMIYGPADYVPPVEVEIVEKRQTIPLDDNEGIYVRDTRSGKVRSETGKSYMLQPHEELWEKDLPLPVEELLAKAGQQFGQTSKRNRTRVVTYRAPHNSAVQIYDYKEKKSRVVFGPELVMLGPDEQFTLVDLSGSKPKKPKVIKTLFLLLGPDFSTDIVTVETSDHARLALQLSYNWQFAIDKSDSKQGHQLFQVPDFVGDMCKAMASKIRGTVAACTFDDFHKNSARVIRSAIFGRDESGKIRDQIDFPANNLVVTNIDIQSVEPVDARTRDSLQKSVQLAIEITTNSQEATARHEAQRIEQQARGRLERQKITDEAEAEKAKHDLLRLQAESAAVESAGQATAEAKAKASAARIEGNASVEQARLRSQALDITAKVELKQLQELQENEIEYQKLSNELEISKAKDLSEIESGKFQSIVESIGPQTIKAIAQAGPELQAKLLKGLGLKSFMITDGNSPINLFNTASGLISTTPTN